MHGSRTKTPSADMRAKGVGGVRRKCDSDEAELRVLFIPVDRYVGVPHQRAGGEFGGLAAMEDRPGDVGGEEAEPQHTCKVRAAYAGLICHLGYGATAVREDLLQLMGCPSYKLCPAQKPLDS